MNEELEGYARKSLKEKLNLCLESQQLFFKRMYAKGKLELPIEEVVDNMEEDDLDWAMRQVQRTLDKVKG